MPIRNFKNILRNKFNVLIEEIIPVSSNRRFKKILEDKIKKLQCIDIQEIDLSRLEYSGDLTKVCLENVKDSYSKSLDRKKLLEDKATVNVLGVTIFISLVSILSSNVIKIYSIIQNSFVEILVFLAASLAVFYMFYGGILALEVLMSVNKIYILNEEETLISEGLQKKVYAKNIDLNGYYNTIRNNYIYSSYQCIRNSLIIFVIIFLISIFPNSNNLNKKESLLFMEEINSELNKQEYEIKDNQRDILELQKENTLLKSRIKSLEIKLQEEVIN